LGSICVVTAGKTALFKRLNLPTRPMVPDIRTNAV
jgi:hypothetical protein